MTASFHPSFFAACVAVSVAACGREPARAPSLPSAPSDEPPPAPREFRAAWVASVANIDWPSKSGLSTAEQKAEIVAIVERARELRLNALVVQVRTSADALYLSDIEPWSEYLTGEQGKAPDPPYDPLKTWVDEAHARGIELHAWFNPYRARHPDAKSPPSPKHISRTRPSLVKSYGGYLWMDPGEPDAVRQTLDVVADVVRRYDVDGAHIDDYFYPYPVPAAAALDAGADGPRPEEDFPDEPSWQAYLASGGTLARADWRRKNVSDLVERMYARIHDEKRWVKFGISPFGLGRPDRRPPGISGFSQYDKLYADVELWLEKGWLDYLAPQLYWPRDRASQAFGTLLDYWLGQNKQRRHVWPGLFTSRIDDSARSWSPDEVLGQVELTRAKDPVPGELHFSVVSLMQNRKGIADRLKQGPYARDALVPASPWLEGTAPLPPRVELTTTAERVRVQLSPDVGKAIARYAVWARYGADWRFTALPAASPEIDLPAMTVVSGDAIALDRVVVSAVDRVGNESRRVAMAYPWTSAL